MPRPTPAKKDGKAPHERPPATFIAYDPEAYGKIVHPNRFDWYLTMRWLPDLGNDAFTVIKVLRNELFYNPAQRALRDECEMSMEELAGRCNLSRTKLFGLFKENWALNRFVERQAQIKIKGDRPHRDVNAFRVCMTDPIHPADEEAYQQLMEQRGAERIAGQMPPKYRVTRDNSYEFKNGTHRNSMSSENVAYESQNRTLSAAMSPESERHKERLLPSEVFTKESLTPAAAPQPKGFPPEGDDRHGGSAVAAEPAPPDPLQIAWQQALLTLSTLVNKPTFEAHIRTLRPVERVGDTVTLCCPSAFTREWIAKRHEAHLADALSAALEQPITVQLVPPLPPPPDQAPIPALLPADVAEKADR